MRLVAGWAREAGLRAGLDFAGNLWALPPDPSAPLVSSGSHVDTVPAGGRLDGALGTVLALEAAEALREGTSGGAQMALLVCAAEEAPRFGAGTVGSRTLLGTLPEADLDDLRDAAGVSVREARAGYLDALADLERLEEPPLERLRAHLEAHVELRARLHANGAQLGVVERVAVPRRRQITLTGEAGHAGEVPIAGRHDALAAAAELVLALERAAVSEAAHGSLAGVARLVVEPGALGVIPGRVVLGLEVRGVDVESMARVEAALAHALAGVGERRGVRVEDEVLRFGDPVALDPGLVEAALEAAERRGVAAERALSGAGHDAQHLAAVVPAGMLFVPLEAGESHTPHEEVLLEEAVAAGEVLIDVLDGA